MPSDAVTPLPSVVQDEHVNPEPAQESSQPSATSVRILLSNSGTTLLTLKSLCCQPKGLYHNPRRHRCAQKARVSAVSVDPQPIRSLEMLMFGLNQSPEQFLPDKTVGGQVENLFLCLLLPWVKGQERMTPRSYHQRQRGIPRMRSSVGSKLRYE